MTHRPGNWALRDRRWSALRQAAKRRDNWQCVKCGSRHRLEVDHIRRVADYPELAFSLDNLQTLCAWHHNEKTRAELGQPPPDPEKRKWRKLLRKPM